MNKRSTHKNDKSRYSKYNTTGLVSNRIVRGGAVVLNGTKYVFEDTFKTRLRNIFIDWGTFLEVYNDNINLEIIYEHIIKLLNLKSDRNEYLRKSMIPILNAVYHLPLQAHLACMLRQFMINQPLSISLYTLFTIVKKHFENIVCKFISVREKYAESRKLKITHNNISDLESQWYDIDADLALQSSSVLLLFLNYEPDTGIIKFANKIPKIVFDIPGADPDLKIAIHNLKKELNNFNYLGYCNKVPYVRLAALMKFPIEQFCIAIELMNSTVRFPNYEKVDALLNKILEIKPEITLPEDTYVRKTPIYDIATEDINEQLKLAKWYVAEILEMRKSLTKVGFLYEEYYVAKAEIIQKVSEEIQKEFDNSDIDNRSE